MKTLYTKAALLAIGLALSATSSANINNDTLEVNFSKHLDKYMDRISAVDKRREISFRRYRADGALVGQRTREVLNRSRFFETEWANERLIPNIDDYSVPLLITEMMKRGIEGANPEGFDGRVVVEIDRLHVAQFPLAVITSHNTRIRGNVELYDSNGSLVTKHRIETGLVPKFTASRNYKGDDYAYLSTAGTTRVGPIVAEFASEALEKVFPDYDAPDLVFLSPNDIGG